MTDEMKKWLFMKTILETKEEDFEETKKYLSNSPIMSKWFEEYEEMKQHSIVKKLDKLDKDLHEAKTETEINRVRDEIAKMRRWSEF